MRSTTLLATVLAFLLVFAVGSGDAQAERIAVFGNNGLFNFINSIGHEAVLVTDAQLATAGFLSEFDAFLYTRDGASFGTSLSAAAAANVKAYVTAFSNIVLFNSDIADGIGDATNRQLMTNAVNFAVAKGGGYIGEFTGTFAAVQSNSNGLTPLGLVAGSAGPAGFGGGGSAGSMELTAAGVGHAVTAGVAFPYNPAGVEFGATLTGVAAATVLATWSDTDNPAIIARTGLRPSALPPDNGAMFMMLGNLSGGGAVAPDGEDLIYLSWLGDFSGRFPGNEIIFGDTYDFDGVVVDESTEVGFFGAVNAPGKSPHTYTGEDIIVSPEAQAALVAGMEALQTQSFDPLMFPELVGFMEPGMLAAITPERLVEFFASYLPFPAGSLEYDMFRNEITGVMFNVDFNTLTFDEDGASAGVDDVLFPHLPGTGVTINIGVTIKRDPVTGGLVSGGGALDGNAQVIPEPGSVVLVLVGLAGAVAVRRRRRKNAA